MDALGFLASWGIGLAAVAGAVAVDRRRARDVRLRLRLASQRELELRRAARDFIAASRESPEAVRAALDAAIRAVAPEIDATLFLERDGDDLHCLFAAGDRASYFLGTRLSLEREISPLTTAAVQGHRVVSRGATLSAIPGDRAFLAVPLVDEARAFGVFYAASRSVDLFAAEQAIVTLVDLAVPAYRLARERAYDRERATIDALTGLLTPRVFRSRLAAACAASLARGDGRLGLLFIDSDNFKSCNDTLGHGAGDVVLRALARIFTTEAGAEALVARNGGDEFCILFSGGTKTETIRRAERVRVAVERHPFAAALDGATLARPITASIGVATLPVDAKTPEMLLERADAAMYHAKRSGRNRVAFYAETGELTALEADEIRYAAD